MPFDPALASDRVRWELENLNLGMDLLLDDPDATLDQCQQLLVVCASRLAALFSDLCPVDSEHRFLALDLAQKFLRTEERLK